MFARALAFRHGQTNHITFMKSAFADESGSLPTIQFAFEWRQAWICIIVSLRKARVAASSERVRPDRVSKPFECDLPEPRKSFAHLFDCASYPRGLLCEGKDEARTTCPRAIFYANARNGRAKGEGAGRARGKAQRQKINFIEYCIGSTKAASARDVLSRGRASFADEIRRADCQ